MPLIQIKTSVPNPEQEQVESLLTHLSAKLATHLGKPESYVMTSFTASVPMTFGGTFEPTCYMEVKSIGTMSSSQTQAMSQDFCNIVSENLGIAKNRIYIEFSDAKGYLWGWNGSTF